MIVNDFVISNHNNTPKLVIIVDSNMNSNWILKVQCREVCMYMYLLLKHVKIPSANFIISMVDKHDKQTMYKCSTISSSNSTFNILKLLGIHVLKFWHQLYYLLTFRAVFRDQVCTIRPKKCVYCHPTDSILFFIPTLNLYWIMEN